MAPNLTAEGFTLLEILLVVVIIGIMSAVGVNIINSQSIERQILNQAQQFSDDLKFICERAVLENHALGIEFDSKGYRAMRYQQAEWLLIEPQGVPEANESVRMDLLLDGRSQQLQLVTASTDEYLPHVICQSDGSFNAFELRFGAADEILQNPDASAYYALQTESPWQLTGAWHQP